MQQACQKQLMVSLNTESEMRNRKALVNEEFYFLSRYDILRKLGLHRDKRTKFNFKKSKDFSQSQHQDTVAC
jgi:hypothetical protein